MHKFILRLVLVLVVSIVAPVCTDVEPLAYLPWFNPSRGSEQTQARMEQETLRMNIREETSVDERGVAELRVLSTMKNPGSPAESMPVRFPAGIGDGWLGVSNIEDISVKADEFSYFWNSHEKMKIVQQVILMA